MSKITMLKKATTFFSLAVLAITTEAITLLPINAQTNSAKNTIFVGVVRNNKGFLYRLSGTQGASNAGNAKWDTCPENTILLGKDFQPNGFWLCASSDIADSGAFYFGNVVNNRGYYWEVSRGQAKPAGDVKWDTCWGGQLRGRLFTTNGFWICQP